MTLAACGGGGDDDDDANADADASRDGSATGDQARISVGDGAFAVRAVSIDGRTGFGIVEFPYLGPMPIAGEHAGTALVTSTDATLDAELAADVLSTVRAERCAVVEEVAIWVAQLMEVCS